MLAVGSSLFWSGLAVPLALSGTRLAGMLRGQFALHSPKLVVLGDSEMILFCLAVMKYD